MVILDLTAADLDVMEPLAALAVAEVDPPTETSSLTLTPLGARAALPPNERWLLCLSSDNRHAAPSH